MRLFSVLFFLTLVGTPFLSRGAPNPQGSRPSQDRLTDKEDTVPAPLEKTGTVRLQTVPGPPSEMGKLNSVESSKSAFRKPRSDTRWQINGGYLTGSYLNKSDAVTSPYLGGMMVWKHLPDAAWDFHANVSTDPLLIFGLGRRTDLNWDTEGKAYWRAGLTQTLSAKDSGNGFFDLERVKFLAGLGIANLMASDESWSTEADLGWGLNGFCFQLQLGWDFDF